MRCEERGRVRALFWRPKNCFIDNYSLKKILLQWFAFWTLTIMVNLVQAILKENSMNVFREWSSRSIIFFSNQSLHFVVIRTFSLSTHSSIVRFLKLSQAMKIKRFLLCKNPKSNRDLKKCFNSTKQILSSIEAAAKSNKWLTKERNGAWWLKPKRSCYHFKGRNRRKGQKVTNGKKEIRHWCQYKFNIESLKKGRSKREKWWRIFHIIMIWRHH